MLQVVGMNKEERSLTGHTTSCYGCFCRLRVLAVGVLIIRDLLFGVYLRAPEFWKLPSSLTAFRSHCTLKRVYRVQARAHVAGLAWHRPGDWSILDSLEPGCLLIIFWDVNTLVYNSLIYNILKLRISEASPDTVASGRSRVRIRQI